MQDLFGQEFIWNFLGYVFIVLIGTVNFFASR